MFTTNAKYNWLSSVTYRNGILQAQLKILAKYNLDNFYSHGRFFCGPDHICIIALCAMVIKNFHFLLLLHQVTQR